MCVCVDCRREGERAGEQRRALATVLFFQSSYYSLASRNKSKGDRIHEGANACVFFVACVDECDAKSCVSIVLLGSSVSQSPNVNGKKKRNNSGDLEKTESGMCLQ